VRITTIDPRTDPLWRRLLERYRSSAFHSPAWGRVLGETYDFDVRAVVLLDDAGEPRAGLAFCRIADALGERIVALPFSDYCDPLVSDPDHWCRLVEALLAERRPLVVRCLHNDLPRADGRFTLAKEARWHGRDLRPDLGAQWGGLPDAARRAIRKAQRDGVVVQIAERSDELRAFFELHLRIRKYKYHLLVQPYAFFENIWRNFIEMKNGLLLVSTYKEKIIASVMFLEFEDTIYYKFNASSDEHLFHRPNDLLIWEGIKYAKSKGYDYMDFGLSDYDQEGLIRYKRKFATEEKAISFMQHVPDGHSTGQGEHVRALLGRLTGLFTDQRVPDGITARAGEALYQLFA
jgi:CelD/BcsL family acetyltransferase involved in cellulose biosynthesis